MKQGTMLKSVLATGLACALAIPGIATADREHHEKKDFGVLVEQLLKAKSDKLFGVKKPLGESAPLFDLDRNGKADDPYRFPWTPADQQVWLADGLQVEYLTRQAADKTDMMAFWPSDDQPTHLITCIEGSREEIAPGKFNPSVQRIKLDTGTVETLLRGLSACDGIRRTPWNTVLVTEERSDGGAYEILNPLGVTEQTVLDRTLGTVTDPDQIAKRPALPIMSWEGLEVLSSGVVIAGDELRPGTAAGDADGGAIFKFIPTNPWSGSVISSLTDSPLATGSTYALQVSCRDDRQQFGQGCEIGNGAWLPVDPANARAEANAIGASGYYRPEDLHTDPAYNGDGIRFCWANTGNEDARNYAEVICGVDSEPLMTTYIDANGVTQPRRTTVINRFLEGDSDFNSFDNLAFQPESGNLYVIEDHPNGDIFACLPDGADRDIKTDGCVKILSVVDSTAEPTGFMFTADGRTAYVSIQHSNDTHMPGVDDYATDDVLKITGFKLHRRHH